MAYLLGGLCFVLFGALLYLYGRLFLIRRAVGEIDERLLEWLDEDSNVGIDISSRDSRMCKLAADMNQQLKLLRQEHIRYVRGDKELKDTITNISHDLRTPLTAVCGYMELLEREELTGEAKRYLEIIGERILALKEMTEELFQYSVILSVDSYDRKERISLNRALEEAIAAHYGALKAAGIEPEIEMPEEAVYRELNPNALSRILQNIISNAIKYSEGDFHVMLQAEGQICFWNYAREMDEIQVGHLFDRFYTVESGQMSTGLGLSIARTLSEDMGGKIDAEYRDGILSICVFFSDTLAKQQVL